MDVHLLLRMIVSLALDYFRWTQLVPMILTWSMIVAMSLVLLFAYNEEAAWSLVELAIKTIQSIPFIGNSFNMWMESQTVDGVFSPDLGAIDYKALALKSWAILSMLFMLGGAILRRLSGPFPPFTLKHKLAVAATASLVVTIAFASLYYFDHGDWGGSFLSVSGSAMGMGLVLFSISAWCLSIAHALGWLSRKIMDPEADAVAKDRQMH